MGRRKNVGVPCEVSRQGELRYAIHNLDLSNVKLSESPLDDYQRLLFATLLSRPNLDQRRNLDVKRVTYKSSIAEAFANPLSGGLDAAQPYDAGMTPRAQGAQRKTSGPSRYVLDCFEYQLPDVLLDSKAGVEQFAGLSEESRVRLGLDKHPGLILDGSISLPGEPVQLEGALASSQGSGVESEEVAPEGANPLTKNQQFKLRKIDHSLQQNNKLINPNNCVLWTHESGYVFLTGIWRLYQDVMRGLISIPRVDTANAAEVQEVCKKELDYIITTAFYESGACPPLNYGDRRRRRQSASSEIPSVSTAQAQQPQGSSVSPPGAHTSSSPLTSHYSDLHWNSLSPDMKQMMCDTYRNHLIHEKGLSPQEVVKCDFAEVVKRVRGGYIKIQGTWLPLETARLLCVRFCYPIRYLLVPIFGPNFPADCENWFSYIQNQLKIREETRIQLSPGPNDMPAQPRRRKRRDSGKSKIKKSGNELLHAFHNLLDISKKPGQVAIPPNLAGRRSSSCAPECTVTQRRLSTEKLPPISSIMQSISPRSSVSHHSDSGYAPLKTLNTNMEGFESTRQDSRRQAPSDPTVQTLSHLASFYNTHGHRYSYPGNVYMSHQRPVTSHFQPSQNSPNDGFFDNYLKKGNQSSTHDAPNTTNYESIKVNDTTINDEKWLPRYTVIGSDEREMSNPASPNQKNDEATTSYADINGPMTYWFSATR